MWNHTTGQLAGDKLRRCHAASSNCLCVFVKCKWVADVGREGDGMGEWQHPRKEPPPSRPSAAIYHPFWRDTKEMENLLCKHDLWPPPYPIFHQNDSGGSRRFPSTQTCSANGRVSFPAVSRWVTVDGEGGQIEVSRVLRRDKHQNKMFLTARGGGVESRLRRPTPWRPQDAHAVANAQVERGVFLGGKRKKPQLGPKISVTTSLITTPVQEKVGR